MIGSVKRYLLPAKRRVLAHKRQLCARDAQQNDGLPFWAITSSLLLVPHDSIGNKNWNYSCWLKVSVHLETTEAGEKQIGEFFEL